MDADAVRAVRDAIVAEVTGQAAALHEEVLSGELGTRALEHRRALADSLRDKILLYEDLLQQSLPALHDAVDTVDQTAAAAVLLASAQAGKEEVHAVC
jgi:hypothetical protein